MVSLNVEPLGLRSLVRLLRRHPGVQGDRREDHAPGDQRATSSALNGRAALGISALPGQRAKIVWYAAIGNDSRRYP